MAGVKGFGRPRSHYRGPESNQCTSCKIIKPLDAFSVGDQRTCRECKRKNYFLLKYGITLGDFDRMIVEQKGLCAICVRRKAVYVDHHHKTGKVRGLLCPPCNTGIGYFFDDESVILRVLEYIRN